MWECGGSKTWFEMGIEENKVWGANQGQTMRQLHFTGDDKILDVHGREAREAGEARGRVNVARWKDQSGLEKARYPPQTGHSVQKMSTRCMLQQRAARARCQRTPRSHPVQARATPGGARQGQSHPSSGTDTRGERLAEGVEAVAVTVAAGNLIYAATRRSVEPQPSKAITPSTLDAAPAISASEAPWIAGPLVLAVVARTFASRLARCVPAIAHLF